MADFLYAHAHMHRHAHRHRHRHAHMHRHAHRHRHAHMPATIYNNNSIMELRILGPKLFENQLDTDLIFYTEQVFKKS